MSTLERTEWEDLYGRLEDEDRPDPEMPVCDQCSRMEGEGDCETVKRVGCEWLCVECCSVMVPCRACGVSRVHPSEGICWSCVWGVEQEVKRRRVDEVEICVEEVPQRTIRRYREVGRA